jgi:4-amino-4-deoxy-L-arabinose transferase-like glycosyltransferase
VKINYVLLTIIVCIFLISVTIGPFENNDNTYELNAAQGILRCGFPYINIYGTPVNQPPIGFYIEALTGMSVYLMLIFGLLSTVVVYEIAKILYNQITGYVAAILFALTPWEIVLTRTFLIDIICLFFSSLSFLISIIAIRRGSLRLFVSGSIVFAVAFLTKFYAVFVLIPIFLFLIYHKRPKKWMLIFLIPAIISTLVWYQVLFYGTGIPFILTHNDFHDTTAAVNLVPSPFFISTFLVSYGLGWLFVDLIIFALILSLVHTKIRHKFLTLDLIWVITIACILGTNFYLGYIASLKVSYVGTLKYSFQSLPFFSLLAASFIPKTTSIFNSIKGKIVTLIGLVLILGAVYVNMLYTFKLSKFSYIVFCVEPNNGIGYSFTANPHPILIIELIGFIILFCTSLVVLLRKFKFIIFKFQKSRTDNTTNYTMTVHVNNEEI